MASLPLCQVPCGAILSIRVPGFGRLLCLSRQNDAQKKHLLGTPKSLAERESDMDSSFLFYAIERMGRYIPSNAFFDSGVRKRVQDLR
jgi:hypothetical protein